MFDVITFGSATRDIFVKTPTLRSGGHDTHPQHQEVCLPLGAKIDVEEIQFLTGGGGMNTAVTFARQGLSTAFCGAIGRDDFGKEIMAKLRQEKIYRSFVVTTEKKLTNQSVIILGDSHDRTILAYRGAADLMTEKEVPWKKLKTAWIYVAPVTGALAENLKILITFAREKNINIALNPSMFQLSLPDIQHIVSQVDVLVMNQEEASFLTGIPATQEEDIFRSLDALCPGITLMTKGGDGVVASDGKQRYYAVPHPERMVVDTTGAGDSFASGFVAEYIRSHHIEKSIQLGMANAEACVAQLGATAGLLKKQDTFSPIIVSSSPL